MQADELKPCPFCGTSDFSKIIGSGDAKRFKHPKDIDCPIDGQWFRPDNWNTRKE